MDVFKKLWVYVGKYKLFLFSGIIFVVFNILASMVPGYINRRIIDDVITIGNIKILPGLLLIYIVITVTRSFVFWGQRYFIESVSQNTLLDLKEAVYNHLQKMSFSFYNRNKTGELMSRMTGDMEAVRRVLAEGVIHITQAIFYLLVTAFILFQLNAKLTLFSLAASPLIGVSTFRLSKTIRPAFSKVRKQFSRLNTAVQENISGIRIVKAFDQQCYEMDKFDEENNQYFRNNYKVAKIWGKYFPIIEFLGGVSTLFLLYFGGELVITGEMTLGVWLQFYSYLWMLVMPMRMLGHLVNMINQTIASGERIFKILEEKPEIVNKENPVSLDNIKGEVEFKNVSLKYDYQYILKDINLHARPGSTIAIMGPTGSGKSSLINLIGRYYEASEGEVCIDGYSVKDLDLNSLRSQVAIVMQDTFLFSETIYKNISYGSPEIFEDELKKAASIAGVTEFIEDMDEDYHTVVGERGMGLSGGQKQRVSIARAIIKKAPILILDDATSAVDMETEYQIQQALETMKQRSTVFIIAHRISSVRNADEIIILKDGLIYERGTHNELLHKKGEYYRVFKEQYKELLKDEKFKQKLVRSFGS